MSQHIAGAATTGIIRDTTVAVNDIAVRCEHVSFTGLKSDITSVGGILGLLSGIARNRVGTRNITRFFTNIALRHLVTVVCPRTSRGLPINDYSRWTTVWVDVAAWLHRAFFV